ncbi:hypothetical protein Z043_103467 [Scleropages formosus]|uniref:Uncharacterized protein n=1 Tax=Scleropages formosus TaxID=113540 RepID=A0A0N8K297_SCLFO|nr:hypothetical protein Z043_103467 [Scleropages formosus]
MEEAGGESAPPCRSAGGARQEDGGTSVPMETGVGDAHAAVSLSPGVPIRGIRMKFAVLRGLVEAGEVPDKDLVETVFSLELHTVTMQEMFTPGRKDTRTPQNVLENIVDSTAGPVVVRKDLMGLVGKAAQFVSFLILHQFLESRACCRRLQETWDTIVTEGFWPLDALCISRRGQRDLNCLLLSPPHSLVCGLIFLRLFLWAADNSLLVGGQFDLEVNFIIQEAESVGCMVELLDQCEATCQVEMWSIFVAILKKSARNLQACTEVGLMELVLARIHEAHCTVADLLIDVLAVLARYSITVRQLKLLVSKLQGENGCWPPHAVKLLSVLKAAPHRVGPDAFFSFPGKSAAAIALPPIAKWPYHSGFTFHTWLRLDPVSSVSGEDKPYVYWNVLHPEEKKELFFFSFHTSKGLGYSAHFVGGCLIVTSLKSRGRGFQHCVKYDFRPQQWYMVTIVHVYNRWKNSEISCYVNGELASYGEITWLVSTSDTFDKCFLGSWETVDASRVFCGQMGAVYLFSEALSAAQILAVYHLGPGYKNEDRLLCVEPKGTFRHRAECDLLFAEHHRTLLYDGKLSSCIAFTYNPRATDGQLCLESSPRDSPSVFVHSPHALMLQDVRDVSTHSVQSAIHSMGGVQVLFPLFAQLDYLQHSTDEVDTSICHTLLSFLMELLRNSVSVQEQVLSCKAFLVIGYILEKSSKVHMTLSVLDIFLALARYLSSVPHGAPLLKQLCDYILFNPAIWVHAAAKVQTTLYTYLCTEFISTVTIYSAIRRVSTVLQVMHTLKYYYWVVNPQDRSGITPKGQDGPRPSQKEMLSLRAYLLLFVKQLILKDSGVKEDELQSILNYLLTMHEDDNLMDVLQLLVALIAEHPSSMVPAFDQRNGIRIVYKLLASESEGIRVQAIKVLGYFLRSLAPKRKADVMVGHSLFSLLSERLLLQTGRFTMSTYNVLFEILTEQIHTQVVHRQHPEPDSSVKILNPQILKVIAVLLKNSPQSPSSMELRRIFLSDMIRLFNNSRENRRCHKENEANLLTEKLQQDLAEGGPDQTRTDISSHADTPVFSSGPQEVTALPCAAGPEGTQAVTVQVAVATVPRSEPFCVEGGPGLSGAAERSPTLTERSKQPAVDAGGGGFAESSAGTMALETGRDDAQAAVQGLDVLVDGSSEAVNPVASDVVLNGEPEVVPAQNTEEKAAAVDVCDEQASSERCGIPKGPSSRVSVSSEHLSDVNSQGRVSHDSLDSKANTAEKEGGDEMKDVISQKLAKEERRESGDTFDIQKSVVEKVEPGNSNGVCPSKEPAKVKEMKITRLDVSSVLSDTERLQPREQLSLGQTAAALEASGQAVQGSSSGRAAIFHSSEFQWSHLHQRLLGDVLFSIETDVQMWRSHSNRTLMDFVSSSDNAVYVHNTVHLLSHMLDNVITACGGILPLLSAATSSSHELENMEPSQGLSPAAASSFLQRVMALADVLLLSNTLSFVEVEAEKNMGSGGILRQCLRLGKAHPGRTSLWGGKGVCAVAVCSCLEQQRHSYNKCNTESASGHGALQSITGPSTLAPSQASTWAEQNWRHG